MPPNAASKVPSSDIASVSSVASSVRFKKAPDVSGGKKLAANRPMSRSAPADRNSLQRSSSVVKLSTTSAAMPSPIQRAA